MNRKIKIKLRWTLLVGVLIFAAIFAFGCANTNSRSIVKMRDSQDRQNSIGYGNDVEIAFADDSVLTDEMLKELCQEVPFDLENIYGYCKNPICRYTPVTKSMIYEFSFGNEIPSSDDDYVYLFEVATFEDETAIGVKEPIAKAMKSNKVGIVFPYEERYLFAQFVPTLLIKGEYVPIATGRYISNPEALASNNELYPEIDSKKGLLLDANTIGTELLTDLNVKRVVFNIPLSYIMGESENSSIGTVKFKYDGKTYDFDGYMLAGFDGLFSYLTENGYHSTAIILNDWNEDFPEMMHPKSRHKTGRSMYYAFNTEEEDGVKRMEAAALFLAKRYSGGEYGMVHDWVIANEVNQQKIWNYMATDNLANYTESFEKSFRTFYNAIKSNYSNAHVYFSVDHDWNDNGGNNGRFFNARDFLYEFNKCAKLRGDYDWGLSVHPYPAPLTKVRFWKGDFDKSETARVLTPMNLATLTELMTKYDFLDTKGNVRNIAVTEVGFSSGSSEELQAAAFAYSYYIIEDNEYISSYLLNRQTDDTESLKSGLKIGIYNNDYSPKVIKDVFANIDTKKGEDYIPRMLEVIGEDSLEQALELAR